MRDSQGLLALVLVLSLIWLPQGSEATIPLPSAPSWSSVDADYGTGAALVDIDGDGDLDLVTGNGNDMEQQRNAVYKNTTGIRLETTASWRSSDPGYHAHLAVGDVDGDGDPDVAIARYGDPGAPQQDRLYTNLGSDLGTSPTWICQDVDNTFSISWGDVDGDGDLDLAAACGESYTSNPQRVKLYLNSGGTLAPTASWQSALLTYAMDVAWGDVDGDGDLDLVVANELGPNHVYRNLGTSLEATPSWASADSNYSLQLDLGDLDGDGDLDLAVADNNQMGGRPSRVRVYRNLGGTFETLPSWTSGTARTYYSCVRWGDVDFDGDLDLAAGGWWEPVEVYENQGGTLESVASWSWHPAMSSNLVCEQLVWGDVDQAALLQAYERPDCDGARRLFYTSQRPLYSLDEVRVAGVPLSPAQYCFDPECGWISLAAPPPPGWGTLEIRYTYSASLDLLVTNWVKAQPNHLFANTSLQPTEVAGRGTPSGGPGEGTATGGQGLLLRVFPSPAQGPADIAFALPSSGEVELAIFTPLGERVRSFRESARGPGPRQIRWDGLGDDGRPAAPGVYVVQLRAAGRTEAVKMVVAR